MHESSNNVSELSEFLSHHNNLGPQWFKAKIEFEYGSNKKLHDEVDVQAQLSGYASPKVYIYNSKYDEFMPTEYNVDYQKFTNNTEYLLIEGYFAPDPAIGNYRLKIIPQ